MNKLTKQEKGEFQKMFSTINYGRVDSFVETNDIFHWLELKKQLWQQEARNETLKGLTKSLSNRPK